MKKRILHFEDKGQDFLQWTLDEHNNVIDCAPFQASVWVGCSVIDSSIIQGECPSFLTKRNDRMTLKYKIEKIETIEN